MEISVDVTGLTEALKAMHAAFPRDARKQKSLLNNAMKAAANSAIVPNAKAGALKGDESGSLSEAITVRNQPVRKLRRKGNVAGVEVVPYRFNRKAMAMYIQHYYTNRGRNPKASIFASGIRHGHLVEYGTKRSMARPFMLQAGLTGKSAYISRVANELRAKTQAAVKRAALKNRVKR